MITRRDMQRAARIVRMSEVWDDTYDGWITNFIQGRFALYFLGERGFEPAYFAALCKQRQPKKRKEAPHRPVPTGAHKNKPLRGRVSRNQTK